MKLNQTQKVELIKASKAGIEQVNMTIQRLKVECPDAFHNDMTLNRRRFHHKPSSDTPCGGFISDRTVLADRSERQRAN